MFTFLFLINLEPFELTCKSFLGRFNGEMFPTAVLSPDFDFSFLTLSNITVKHSVDESSLIFQFPNLGTEVLSDWEHTKKNFSINYGL